MFFFKNNHCTNWISPHQAHHLHLRDDTNHEKITKKWFSSFNNSEWMKPINLLCGAQRQQTKNMEVIALFAHSNSKSLNTRKIN